jgi:hypothetical protein
MQAMQTVSNKSLVPDAIPRLPVSHSTPSRRPYGMKSANLHLHLNLRPSIKDLASRETKRIVGISDTMLYVLLG